MSKNRQLDLFVALIGDIPFRDERESMTAPLVSLSKNKRTRIEWEGPGGQHVLVTAAEEYGVATIWDYDVLLWAISQINEAINQGKPVTPRITFHPYNLLSAVGRDTGGQGYAELKAAFNRLTSTSVSYSSPALKGKRRATGIFNLLGSAGTREEDGKIKEAWIELAPWLYEAVTLDRDVLAISPKYFDLTSGLDRFLYRLARRHVGKQAGWAFTFRDLHGRSGSSQTFGEFSRDLRKAIKRNALPEYSMTETKGANGPTLSINRDPMKLEWHDRRFDF